MGAAGILHRRDLQRAGCARGRMGGGAVTIILTARWGRPAAVALSALASVGALLVGIRRLKDVTTVEVRGDGLLLRGNRWGISRGAPIVGLADEGRFLPFAEVARVSLEGDSLVVIHPSGTRLNLGIVPAGSPQQREAIVARVEEARTAFARADVPPDWRPALAEESAEALHVARGGRSVVEWVRGLRATRDYRTASFEAERLWRVVEDGAQLGTTRAGAALVLSAELDDDGRARLRVASRTCAEPRLRVALERVTEGAEEGALQEALHDLVASERS
jgi:hypothetical protein